MRAVRVMVLPVMIAVAVWWLAGCGPAPAPSGPGTATLDILGQRGECHSFGGCGWVARLAGPAGMSEANFQIALEGSELALGDGLPAELADGAYTLTFEQQLLSDAITAGQPRDFFVSATCSVGLAVPGGRSVFHVRVTFEEEKCSVSTSREQLE